MGSSGAPEDPITAGCERAVVSAGVGVFNVAVVTGLPVVEAPVAAAQRDALARALIIVGVVAIIALLKVGMRRVQVAT